jgi:hypothetical protein
MEAHRGGSHRNIERYGGAISSGRRSEARSRNILRLAVQLVGYGGSRRGARAYAIDLAHPRSCPLHVDDRTRFAT